MLQIPVSVISGEIYSMVRDQKYLIGKKLCNIQEVQPQKPDSTVAAY